MEVTGRVVGFTGTAGALTAQQVHNLLGILGNLYRGGYRWLAHGDCEGGDAAAHDLATRLGMLTWGHPPNLDRKRAFCICNRNETPKPYLERNHRVVDVCHVLLAAPRQPVEVTRSGTWATVRYARRLSRPLMIFLPDGTTLTERLHYA